MQTPAMQLSELTKNLGSHRAVYDLTLTVPRGSMFGVVSPNGAGKTTTLSMATGLLRPDGGRVEILGHDAWRDPARAKSLIGVLPDGLRTSTASAAADCCVTPACCTASTSSTSPAAATNCSTRSASTRPPTRSSPTIPQA